MQFSCYIEINIICMIIMGIMYGRVTRNRSIASTSQIAMKRLVIAVCLLCIFDIVAIISRGRFFPGARVVIEVSNMLYLLMMSVISMLWLYYVASRIGEEFSGSKRILVQLPLLLLLIACITNPWTNFMFSVSAENLYKRGPGVIFHWIVSWYYMCYAGIIAAKAIRSTPSWSLKNQYKPFLYFMIFPAIACVVQMTFYGVTSVQAGITLALILVSMQMQDNQISVDELTGINNRKSMRDFVENQVHKNNPPTLNILMIDVNKFKSINDTYGHAIGDIALKDTADILRNVCRNSKERLFLCRYGGDEFLLIAQDASEEALDVLVQSIRSEVEAYVRFQDRPYKLSVSIGYSSAICHSFDEFTTCMHNADENMYDDKKQVG